MSEIATHCRRSLLLLLPLAVLSSASTCEFEPAGCENLDAICPDLECDNYKQNRDGCSICECEEDETPTVCWDDSECAVGERCDTVNFCEPAPGCTENGDEPCPAACYGQCVPAPTGCASDADCPDGQICGFFGNARPDGTEPDSGGSDDEGAPGEPDADPIAPVPSPDGVCVPAECDALVDLPACPPGTEASFDFGQDPCGNPICIPIDPCRDLPADVCAATPGCALVEEPCFCDPDSGACDACETQSRCVSVDPCGGLTPDECRANPNCELVDVGAGGGGGGSDGGAQCQICDANGECRPCDAEEPPPDPAPAPPPPDELVCVQRGGDGTCLVDAECAPGDVCVTTVVCATGCRVNEDGTEECFEECWNERGFCTPSTSSCFNLDPDACVAAPECELVSVPCECAPGEDCVCTDPAPTQCVPRSGTCLDSTECLPGQHCELVETCPPCDPTTGDDIGCVAPCFVEGRCVDGPPPPLPCNGDAECPFGHQCLPVDVCTTCADGGGAPPPDGDPIAPPPPCETTCTTENVCIATEPVCFSDVDCKENEFCDFSAGCDQPGGLVFQCPGTCLALVPPTLCQEDAQCPVGQRCPTELDFCVTNPDDPSGGCWWQCVDRPSEDGAFCLDDGQCDAAAGEICQFHPDVCLDDPNLDAEVCSGWCIGACGDAITNGLDPVTEQCVTFSDTCVPPGWIAGGC